MEILIKVHFYKEIVYFITKHLYNVSNLRNLKTLM